MTGMLCLVSLIPIWLQHWNKAYVLWGLALIVFLLPAITFPALLGPVYRGWMKFALVLGRFNSRIILSIVFYLMFTPISLFFKIVRRDSLNRKIRKDGETYWIDRSQEEYNPKHFERQF